jgi:uncharacterized protein (UPF0371 family)
MADDRAPEVAFDNERYLAEQSEAILERMRRVGGKLHLEFTTPHGYCRASIQTSR